MGKVRYKNYVPRTREPILRWQEELHKKHPERLDFRDEQLLWSIKAQFALNRTEREQLLGWSKDAWSRHVPKLMEWGFVTQEKVSFGGRGSSFTVLVLTEKGNKYLKEHMGETPLKIHGSALHYFAMVKVKEWMEGKGYKVRITEKAGNRLPDLYARKGGEVIAVEIAASDNAHRDMRKFHSLAEEVDRIACVVIGKKLKTIYEKAADRHLEREARQKLGIHEYRSLIGS